MTNRTTSLALTGLLLLLGEPMRASCYETLSDASGESPTGVWRQLTSRGSGGIMNIMKRLLSERTPVVGRLEADPFLFEDVEQPRRRDGSLLKKVPVVYAEVNQILHFSTSPEDALYNLDVMQRSAADKGQRICWRKTVVEQMPLPTDRDSFAQKVACRGGALHNGPPNALVRQIGAAVMRRMLDEDPAMAWGAFRTESNSPKIKSEQPILGAMAHANVEVCQVMFNHKSCDTYLKDVGNLDKFECGLHQLMTEMERHIKKKIRGLKATDIQPAVRGEADTPEGQEVLKRRYECLKLAFDAHDRRNGENQRMFERVMHHKTGLPTSVIGELTRGLIRMYHPKYSNYSADHLDSEHS